MKLVLTNSVLLVASVILIVNAHAQSHPVESAGQVNPSDVTGKLRAPDPLGQAFSPGPSKFPPPVSRVPYRSPDLGSPTAPLSPSIGPGSGLLGPESGRGPTRLRSGTETRRGEGTTGRDGR